MSESLIIELAREALLVVLKVAGPMLGLGLLVGLLVSVFQATTQIQEQTLAFIPKILAIMGAIVWFGPWMLRILVDFAQRLFLALPSFVQ
ncbi:MAG: flagellar biosynthesis protein FliQ [Firmicutes bacterium]|nr:flagellar biosynthesis protein FliQ [Bacillota bacterium]